MKVLEVAAAAIDLYEEMQKNLNNGHGVSMVEAKAAALREIAKGNEELQHNLDRQTLFALMLNAPNPPETYMTRSVGTAETDIIRLARWPLVYAQKVMELHKEMLPRAEDAYDIREVR